MLLHTEQKSQFYHSRTPLQILVHLYFLAFHSLLGNTWMLNEHHKSKIFFLKKISVQFNFSKIEHSSLGIFQKTKMGQSLTNQF